MFTRRELIERLDELLQQTRTVDVSQFGQVDFESPSSEEEIIVHRAPFSRISDPMLFWVSSVVAQDWAERETYLRPYLQRSLCKPLSEEDFTHLVDEYSVRLRQSIGRPLQPKTGFRTALQMDDDWNSVAAVAMYTDELVAFYWSTSA
jgi:hypothetical protein